ncbi:stress response protein YhaX [Brevibacillus reuszeri]|uniref:Hydrolase n=1 Tax=Brevibacillus reuszeri TaxID=54915 RepID=A0A0K9YSF7_9BACL|nr:Cof-type HAD-IIB family hydrolase [Brevibacillus reuszeri]KNB71653.1 hydrolase [Brevibacillus reuszeri]MED1855526.1 Cof-type HAD-IIB family hydrolase [Brevibacillus reuszeri]GED67324.1 stress response protein YhaX [Brevibacillus reuszeri]
MNYKLLALDVDGTILMSNHTLSKVTLQAITELTTRGIYVTLATGRAYPSAKTMAKQFQIRVPLISHDGAYVADPLTDEVLFVKRIPTEVVTRITEILVEYGLDVMLLHESYAVTNRSWKWRDLFPLLNPSTLRQLWKNLYPLKIMASCRVAEYVREKNVSVPKIFVMGEPERLAAARRELAKAKFKEIRVTASGDRNLEILPEGISKATGLAVLGEKLDIIPEQMVAVGDNYNDVEMLQFAGMGVAMGNAPDAVKKLARQVTDTNDQHGVAAVIQRFFHQG